MTTSTYLFGDAPPDTRDDNAVMLDALAGMLDPFSRRQLRRVGVRADARCLVVAVGASCIAATLAEMAPHGEVTATDLDLTECRRHPRVRLIRHNIVTDLLPDDGYDLIHVRLLLAHLPTDQRTAVLTRLVDALTPGGLLIVEEFEPTWRSSVLSAPDLEDADRLFAAYHQAFGAALTAAGNDLTWGRRAHHAMRALGLHVDTTGHTGTWTGGQPGCLLPYATAGVIRDRLIAAGMTPDDIDAFRTLLLHPDLVVKGNLALSHVGRAPTGN
ncbi:class I SAM-dependent methyltransferase [Micromonospora sp. NBC_01813]|uniref:class I SAM-dependent methyltransferase n=1 Tax=Micromonospora sp. NBC_01813 TaxID=2975988 RepID=UPI002DDC20F1|nr:class I SAM-dependent methyltransferase [Micromonospora sp. NBC_01813]WSA06845.1 class I SAM-dependent methyltransferase [Micromonospora sp. NBC_01813]